ncbi:cytokine receptor-like factor 2 isoform X2 [Carassius carassius]|uniref:cytokine receptor-like factor 2 isoform X2 n=1 Tax=Carassius carassius TaxID=217509 RepID=UPI002868F73E|nr:cytokine receptor-like factor 2 isoform X2 [Carassius carassius]
MQDIHSIKVKQTQMENHLNLTYISMKKNYDFRIRMRKECLQKPWSNWTKVQSWGNNAGACVVEASAYIWVYILIIVLPLTAFLLVCLLTQQGIRRLIFPEVPDPKHFKNKIMDAEQFQLGLNHDLYPIKEHSLSGGRTLLSGMRNAQQQMLRLWTRMKLKSNIKLW